MDSRDQHMMKVKVIVTKVVETEAHQFKSVVQNLTGKDSAWLLGFDDISTDHHHHRTYAQMKRQSFDQVANHVVQTTGGYVGLVPTMEELFEFLRD